MLRLFFSLRARVYYWCTCANSNPGQGWVTDVVVGLGSSHGYNQFMGQQDMVADHGSAQDKWIWFTNRARQTRLGTVKLRPLGASAAAFP